MTNDEESVWANYTQGVQKLGEKPVETKPKKPRTKSKKVLSPPPEITTPQKTETPTIVAALSSPHVPWKKEPLDLRVERNLSLGDVMIEARVDLHGLTEQAAYEKLQDFLAAQVARGRRLVLVITGKGRDGDSVLRVNMPRWCDVAPLDQIVLAVRTAAPQHGGDGAYYVLLRRATK